MTETPSIAWFVEQLKDRSTKDIALIMTALIRSGAIPIGAKLPPVRELAQALGTSPATLSAAWSQLRRYNVVSGQGRNGVWVSGDKVTMRPVRFTTIGNFGNHIVADLTSAVPDPGLLPDLGAALAYGLTAPDLNCYQDAPIAPLLKEVVAPGWPYPAEAYLSANGGYDAVRLALQTLVMPGSTVAVEDPTAMRVLDILDNLSVHVIPVACDDSGPECASLAEAMKHKPAAFIYQPRTHAVTGRHLTAERLADMAALLKDSSMFLIEDDGLGDISCHPPGSLGIHYPERTVHILSYSKSLGPDLRMAVLSSSSEIVDQIMAYRSFGSRWTSRILQYAVAWLLNDPSSMETVAKARTVYARRREALVGALQAHGVTVPGGDGLCLWMPVPSEQYAMVTLAARGVAVLPGARFCVHSGQYLRIATSLLSEHIDEVAEALSLSSKQP